MPWARSTTTPFNFLPLSDTAVSHRFDAQAAVAAIHRFTTRTPQVALILGSGLGALADEAEDAVVVPMDQVPGYPLPTVAGHAGRVVIGQMEGVECAFLQGRVHAYEGHPPHLLGASVRLLHALGARSLVVTNAAGGIAPALTPGALMLIEDHLNLTGLSPLTGPVAEGEPRFPDMSEPYDAQWRAGVKAEAAQHDIELEEGVYAWMPGPAYETRAEVRMVQRMGGDAVGMSTVPEVLTAVSLGMKVLGVSTITNRAAGMGQATLSHDEVIEIGQSVQARLSAVVRAALRLA
jgi:purine-nucleoside phosphorylase